MKNLFKFFLWPFLLVLFFCSNTSEPEQEQKTEDFLQIISPKSYHITNSIVVNNTGKQLSKLILILPLAQTNNYQEVNNVQATGAEILSIPETDDKYVRYTITGSDLPSQGETKQWGYNFDVTLHSININLVQISTIYPYNTPSNIYQWYTGTSGEIVDPNNLTIQSIGDTLWDQSSDLLDYTNIKKLSNLPVHFM